MRKQLPAFNVLKLDPKFANNQHAITLQIQSALRNFLANRIQSTLWKSGKNEIFSTGWYYDFFSVLKYLTTTSVQINYLIYPYILNTSNKFSLTLDFDNGVGFNYSQFRSCHTSVVTCVSNILQFQNILSYGQLIIWCQVPCALSPFNKRHRTSNSHTSNVDISSILNFIFWFRSDGKMWRNTSNSDI